MKKVLLFLTSILLLSACTSNKKPGEIIEPEDTFDEDDLWVEPEVEIPTDPDELKKEGEKYLSYVDNTPHILETMPVITVRLSEDDSGFAPRLENTYLTTGRKDDKGPSYPCKVSVNNGEEVFLEDGDCQIKVRGNYTANYSKKPFQLKFDKKQAMPGFDGEFKKWVLLADVKDHSNLRNLLSFHLGDVLFNTYGNYSSHYQPVELNFIDGTGQTRYWGTYLLCEQQEIKSGRVDITDVGDLKGDDNKKGSYNGTDIGYFIECDGYYTEERPSSGGWWPSFFFSDQDFKFSIDDGSSTGGDATFTIPYNNRARYQLIGGGQGAPNVPGFTFKSDVSSDDPTDQLNFISRYMENVYLILYNATYNNRFMAFNDDYSQISVDQSLNSETAISNVIDIDSLVNMYILQEIACDSDIAWSSFYMDVDFGEEAENHLLRFEAPWDFDGAYGVRNGGLESGKGYFAATSNNPWLSIIMNNDWFLNKVKERYNELYSYDILSGMINYIDEISNAYEEAYVRNVERWGSGDETGEVRFDWARLTTQKEHAAALKGWLLTRFNYFTETWLNGFDVMTHQKDVAPELSVGNIALKENGKKYRFEAENAGLSNGGSIKYDKNVKASEDFFVGELNSGATLSFAVKASKRKQAYFTIGISKGMQKRNLNDMFDIYVNNTKLETRTIIVPAMNSSNYYDWVELDLYSSWLEIGENEIKFVSKNNATNFDYLDIYSKDRLTILS